MLCFCIYGEGEEKEMKWIKRATHLEHRWRLVKESLTFQAYRFEFECIDCGALSTEIRNPTDKEFKVTK
jgi:hypothetical protein